MRALRNSINTGFITACAAGICVLTLSCASAVSDSAETDPREIQDAVQGSAYFPLSVGNRWRYSCSVEGEYLFDKTLTITGRELHQGMMYFVAQLHTGDDPASLNLYYHADESGGIHRSVDPAVADDTLLVSANPVPGDRIGKRQVAREEAVETPATGTVAALLIENFSLDDPQLHEEQRMDWEGKYYARGIGLVIEADGLGGACALQEYVLQSP
ncbi:MAG: hypothetical protein ABW076_05335 [Candidatus Thiodiazotropha sp.]